MVPLVNEAFAAIVPAVQNRRIAELRNCRIAEFQNFRAHGLNIVPDQSQWTSGILKFWKSAILQFCDSAMHVFCLFENHNVDKLYYTAASQYSNRNYCSSGSVLIIVSFLKTDWLRTMYCTTNARAIVIIMATNNNNGNKRMVISTIIVVPILTLIVIVIGKIIGIVTIEL